MPDNYVRLSKLLSQRGICSRREADRYIEEGQVIVDGKIISVLGTKVCPKSKIELANDAKQNQDEKVTILLNKPIGYVSTQPEKGYREALELITEENQFDSGFVDWEKKIGVGGRLDIDSKGLLVFSQDGAVIRRLIGPDSEIEKEYLVRVAGDITEDKMDHLRFGLFLDGKGLKEAGIDQLEENVLRFTLKEGKKRQIRRMCELVNLSVVGLKRVRIGGVRLGKLPEGKWRLLKPDEAF